MPDAGSHDRTAMHACRRARPALLARSDATAFLAFPCYTLRYSAIAQEVSPQKFIATAPEVQQQMKSQHWSQCGQNIQSVSSACHFMKSGCRHATCVHHRDPAAVLQRITSWCIMVGTGKSACTLSMVPLLSMLHFQHVPCHVLHVKFVCICMYCSIGGRWPAAGLS